ncbi:MAG: NAD(P)H-hydrate dehydratase [Planctomycetota bacterium]
MLIVAGSRDFAGAAALAAWGALRAGAGLVRVALPAVIHPALCARVLPATWLPLPATRAGTFAAAGLAALRAAANAADVAVIGPGVGRVVETARLVQRLVRSLALPLVLDADGLNAFAGHPELLVRSPPTVITPHPGELARLAPDLTATTDRERVRAASSRAAVAWWC